MQHESADALRELSERPINQAGRAMRSCRYEDAIAILRQLPNLEEDFLALGGLGWNYLLQGDLHNAASAFKDMKRTYWGARCASPALGSVLWLLGQHEDACKDWTDQIAKQRAGAITNTTDEAGGVILPSLLWWASTHEASAHWRKPAEAELARKWKTKTCQRSPWPGLLAAYLRRQATEEDLLSVTKDPKYPEWEDEQRRRALFFIAARRRADGDTDAARAALEEVASPVTEKILTDVEFHLARHELGITGRVEVKK